MNDSSLLHALREATGSSRHAAKRHIVRFKSRAIYLRFVQLLNQASDLLPAKSAIRPIRLISAISCPLAVPTAILHHPSIRSIETDAPIRMRAVRSNALAQPFGWRQGASAVPWGIRQMNVPDVWTYTRGNHIRVGVIDTGIDYYHPDLRGRIANGFNVLQRGAPPIDDNGHGTHISGTIAAANPYSGLLGVAPQAMIHPVKAFDQEGTAYISDIVLGIDWCVRNRMHIINMSFGMKTRSRALHDAVRNAYQQGIPVVASSGNEGKRSSAIDYPARFPESISVGATRPNKRIAAFSNRGKSIDIYAPGSKTKSTWLNSNYMELSGTSMATSHVSGVIALMLTVQPQLTPDEIKTLLKQTSQPISGLGTKWSSRAGELDASRLLHVLRRRKKAAQPHNQHYGS